LKVGVPKLELGNEKYGDTVDGVWYQELLEQETTISTLRDGLIFGKAYAETPD
jgi:nitrite reductase (NADH) large subunit